MDQGISRSWYGLSNERRNAKAQTTSIGPGVKWSGNAVVVLHSPDAVENVESLVNAVLHVLVVQAVPTLNDWINDGKETSCICWCSDGACLEFMVNDVVVESVVSGGYVSVRTIMLVYDVSAWNLVVFWYFVVVFLWLSLPTFVCLFACRMILASSYVSLFRCRCWWWDDNTNFLFILWGTTFQKIERAQLSSTTVISRFLIPICYLSKKVCSILANQNHSILTHILWLSTLHRGFGRGKDSKILIYTIHFMMLIGIMIHNWLNALH